MDSNVESTAETLGVNKEDAHHMVDSLLQRLTPEQLEFFSLDGDDSAKKVILSDVLLELMVLVTKCVLMRVRSSTEAEVSDERVLSTLSETLPQTFSEALTLSQELHRGNSQSLSSLISLRVARSVNSALSARSARAESTEPVMDVKDAPPGSLNAVVQHASELIQDGAEETQTPLTSPPSRSSISPMSYRSGEDGSKTPGQPPSIERPRSAMDSLLSAMSRAVDDALSREVSDLMGPSPSGVSDEVFVLSETGSLSDITTVAHDIAESILDELEAEDGAGGAASHSQ